MLFSGWLVLFSPWKVNAKYIACGGKHSGVVTSAGVIWTWGYNGQGKFPTLTLTLKPNSSLLEFPTLTLNLSDTQLPLDAWA